MDDVLYIVSPFLPVRDALTCLSRLAVSCTNCKIRKPNGRCLEKVTTIFVVKDGSFLPDVFWADLLEQADSFRRLSLTRV